MKKILVIGSAVVDVVINLEHLPAKGEDVHVLGQHMQLGGCGYNVSDMIRHFDVPYIPFFPVGSGAYGSFVREAFAHKQIQTPIPPVEQPNGCCYCFVEEDGERTFASWHGAEYLFQPEWLARLNADDIQAVYICGLEIEEATGHHIVSWLEQHPSLTIYFAPGPRLSRISPSLMGRLFALHPILHLNAEEACSFTNTKQIIDAAHELFDRTGNHVLITLGADGCCHFDGQFMQTIPSPKVSQTDTNGAGDAHIGAVIALRSQGFSFIKAIKIANRISASVVQQSGALISDEDFTAVYQTNHS